MGVIKDLTAECLIIKSKGGSVALAKSSCHFKASFGDP